MGQQAMDSICPTDGDSDLGIVADLFEMRPHGALEFIAES